LWFNRDVKEPIEERHYGPEFREQWGDGEWDTEPDSIEWTDPDHGYRCVMRRNDMGAWCGYVAVNSSHPAHGMNAADVGDELACHWGVTWSGLDAPWSNVETDGVNDLWWFGFDCAHAYDYVPSLGALGTGDILSSPMFKHLGLAPEIVRDFEELFASSLIPRRKATYKNVAYVKEQIAEVVMQLVVYSVMSVSKEEKSAD